jgi:hypothetical protein
VNKLQGLAQKIIVVRHLFPLRIFSSALLGLAAKIEMGMQSPILDGPYLIQEDCCDAACYFGKSIFTYCCIGQNDAEKNGGLAG